MTKWNVVLANLIVIMAVNFLHADCEWDCMYNCHQKHKMNSRNPVQMQDWYSRHCSLFLSLSQHTSIYNTFIFLIGFNVIILVIVRYINYRYLINIVWSITYFPRYQCENACDICFWLSHCVFLRHAVWRIKQRKISIVW
jgi:hypothetical protein